MPVSSELSTPLSSTARVDRVHPPLNSRADTTELTGPQRIEAKASDVVAALALQIKMDAPIFTKLGETLGRVESLADLTQRVSDLCGNRVLGEVKAEVIKRFGMPNPDNDVPFAIREAALQWARQEDSCSEADVSSFDPSKAQTSLKDESKQVFKPSKSGKPRGPGSHTRGTRGKRA